MSEPVKLDDFVMQPINDRDPARLEAIRRIWERGPVEGGEPCPIAQTDFTAALKRLQERKNEAD